MNASGRFIVPLLLLGSTLGFASQSDDRIEQIDRLLQTCRSNGLINGVALVAEKGRIRYHKALGTANVEWNIPCALNTRFSLFSISKQFTAMLGMMLAAEGKLNLEARVSEYLPWFRKDTGDQIKVRHLFNHSHGIPYLRYDKLPYRNRLGKVAFFKAHYSEDLAFVPGQGFLYGDGFDILAAIIEEITERSFEELLNERILHPLQMNDSGIWHVSQNIPRMATNYQTSLARKSEALYELPLNGSSALYGTAEDLLKWQRALAEGRLLPPEYQQEMWRVQIDFGRPYGYGFDISEMEFAGQKKKLVWHEGGASAILLWVLDDDKLVVLLNNFNGENYRVALEILKILYGCPHQSEIRRSD